MMRTLLILLMTGMSFLISCKKKIDDYSSRGTEYFPLRIGAERLCYYDSTHYSRLQNNTWVFHYLIKEFVKDTFTDQSGKLAYRLEQFRFTDTGRSFQFYDLIMVFLGEYGVQRVGENIRLLKISLPRAGEVLWNLNSRNNLPPVMLSYQNLYEPYHATYVKSDTAISITS